MKLQRKKFSQKQHCCVFSSMINALTEGCDFVNSSDVNGEVLHKHDNGLKSHRDWFMWNKRRENVIVKKYTYLVTHIIKVKKVQWFSSEADARTWLPLIIEKILPITFEKLLSEESKVMIENFHIDCIYFIDICFCTSTSYYVSCLFSHYLWNPRIFRKMKLMLIEKHAFK